MLTVAYCDQIYKIQFSKFEETVMVTDQCTNYCHDLKNECLMFQWTYCSINKLILYATKKIPVGSPFYGAINLKQEKMEPKVLGWKKLGSNKVIKITKLCDFILKKGWGT